MTFETEKQKKEIQRWIRPAIQLNGAAESGRFDHITTAVIARELPVSVWEISNSPTSTAISSRRSGE